MTNIADNVPTSGGLQWPNEKKRPAEKIPSTELPVEQLKVDFIAAEHLRGETGDSFATLTEKTSKRQKVQIAMVPQDYWHQYKKGDITLAELFMTSTSCVEAFSLFREWLLNSVVQGESPVQLIGTLELMAKKQERDKPATSRHLKDIAQQAREIGITFQRLPRDIKLDVGRKLSIHQAKTFGNLSRELYQISPKMQIRTLKQANKLLMQLLQKAPQDPARSDEHARVFAKWLGAIPKEWPIEIKLCEDMPEALLAQAYARFGNKLTLLISFSEIDKIAEKYPNAMLSISLQKERLHTLGQERFINEVNKIFESIPTIRAINLEHYDWPATVLEKIRWPENLEALSCCGQNVRQFLPNLPATLQKLSCDCCHLTDADLGLFSRFTMLQELNLTNNSLQAGLNLHLLPQRLVKLSLAGCKLTDGAIDNLSHFKQLQILKLGTNEALTGQTFGSLPHTLLELKCDECEFPDEAFENLSHLTRLKVLNINTNFNSELQGDCFSYLPDSLEVLRCRGCALIDSAVEQLAHLSRLKELDISLNQELKGTSFHFLPPSIEQLRCTACDLTDEAIRQLSRLHNLQMLDVGENAQLQGTTFGVLPNSLYELASPKCNVKNLKALSHLQLLQKLDIDFNSQIDSQTVAFLPRTLRVLKCSGCKLPDEALASLKQQPHPPAIHKG